MLKVLKFSAAWCIPCRVLAPVFHKVAGLYNDVVFETIDVDDYPEVAAQFKISAVPTMLFIKDDKVIKRLEGLQKESVIVAAIEECK